MGVFSKDGDDDCTGKTTQNRRYYNYYYNYNPNYYNYFYYYHHHHHHHHHHHYNYYNHYKGSICIYGTRTGRQAKKDIFSKKKKKKRKYTIQIRTGREGGKTKPPKAFLLVC